MTTVSGSSNPFTRLYAAYSLACLGDRLWTFAIVFVLEHLGGIQLVGINQFIDSIAAMTVSTYLGNWLDRNNRKHGTLTVLLANNFSIAVSSGFLVLCLTFREMALVYHICLLFSIVSCALAKCASEGEGIAFTKDWIVVMAQREGKGSLARRNAIMKSIDQFACVITPLLTGYLIVILGHRSTCVIFIGWNLLSWAMERYLLSKVYESVVELHGRREDYLTGIEMREMGNGNIDSVPANRGSVFVKRCLAKLSIYMRQEIYAAGVGLAFLYFTVLGFDGLSTSFGRSQGLPEDLLGIFRSAGALFGFLGAGTYVLMEHSFGVRSTGLVGLLAQLLFLVCCLASVWLPGSPIDLGGYFFDTHATVQDHTEVLLNSVNATTAYAGVRSMDEIDWHSMTVDGRSIVSVLVLLIGIAVSRFDMHMTTASHRHFCLWVADLSIVQIMQESVAESERGTVFGAQNALQNLFSLLKDLTIILLPDPRTFGLLVIISVAFVVGGVVSFCVYLYQIKFGKWKPVSTSDAEDGTASPADDSQPEQNLLCGEALHDATHVDEAPLCNPPVGEPEN